MPGIDECLLAAMTLPGARGAAVVDWISGLALGTAGESPSGDHEVTAAETAELARMAAEHTAFVPPDAPEPEKGAPPVEGVIVTAPGGHHLIHFVGGVLDSSVFVHLWIDRREGNLALARIRLREIAESLVPA
ncbi:hypothetical protein [Streptomyces sp. ST2-7A]|uniref:hypothetical protein n=1 Tax=Streptomyces sp. ST2-7A TaxID=2907214 RepID=UPI001F293016|nr:hypothetical protein [Streptomyces sp. ST2-7A]MCE7079113.1 hypothetical protein [Streptomyces sp. ST2-7A]